MGRWWASNGHYVYGPDPLPNFRRFRISTPGQRTTDGGNSGGNPDTQGYQGGLKNKQRQQNFQQGGQAAAGGQNPHNQRPNQRKNYFSKGGNPTTMGHQNVTPYERTYIVLPEINIFVEVTDTTLITPVQQPRTTQVETSVGTPHLEEPTKGASDSAPIISGSLDTSEKLTEYLEVTVFQDDNRTKQGNAHTDTAQPHLPSGLSIASRALLDTGSMAGDFVSKNIVIRLNALHKCYSSPSALNVCSGLDGTC